jgi:hypothetical protein
MPRSRAPTWVRRPREVSSIAEIHFVRQLERRIEVLEAAVTEAELGLRHLAQLYTELEVRLDSPRPQPQSAQRR